MSEFLKRIGIIAIDSPNITDISGDLLLENGKLKLLSYKEYEKYPFNDFRIFCHNYARYGIPTIELVDCIKGIINGRSAIEIGSGHGDLGYHLGIPMTDSKLQSTKLVSAYYQSIGQPTIKYPKDVEKIEALEAVKKYKPQVVVGSWLATYGPHQTNYPTSPYGIEQDEILENVETFIHLSNLDLYGKNPLLDKPHTQISEPWVMTRSINPKNNRLFIFG